MTAGVLASALTAGVVMSVVTAGACSKRSDAPPSPVIAKSRALADQACACTTVACADPIDRQWAALASETSASLAADDVDAMAEESQRYLRCLVKVPLTPAALLEHARALADQVCACGADAACARPLQLELDRRLLWTFATQAKFEPAQQTELSQLLQNFSTCALKAGVEPTPK
ncbi:MAG: hypothetical protein H0T89_30880 [Deltaproteobacteria bacterium]|nr:hypothetical protein [Deltaproteobacteria bacterium]MDQ3295372.1 hypothetical protein [Myxococcota bacterium]